MPSPTTVRSLFGHFPRGADPPAVQQRVLPLPVRSPTSSSLQAILVAGAGGGGARGGVGGRRSPRDGGGGGRGTEGGIQGLTGNDAWHRGAGAREDRGNSDYGDGGGWAEMNNSGPASAKEG